MLLSQNFRLALPDRSDAPDSMLTFCVERKVSNIQSDPLGEILGGFRVYGGWTHDARTSTGCHIPYLAGAMWINSSKKLSCSPFLKSLNF